MKKTILSRFTNHVKNSIERARLLALAKKAKKISNFHLLCAIFYEKGSVGHNMLREMGISEPSLLNFKKNFYSAKSLPFNTELRNTLKRSVKVARDFHYPYVGTEHLIYAILESGDRQVKRVLKKSWIESPSLPASRKNSNTRRTRLMPDSTEDLLADHSLNAESNLADNVVNDNLNSLGPLPDFMQAMNLPLMTKPQSNGSSNPLERFANNLNEENLKDDTHPIIGKENETDRMINILLRKNKNNPVLVGEPGVGKTAIVSALAQRINQGEVPSALANKVIYELDLGSLLSGTTFRGEFEQRMKEVINYASKNEEVILFIDEIHNLIGTGNAQGSLDAANMLKPALAKGKLKLIGATTLDEYKKYIEQDPALERRFQPIQIFEPQEAETRKILNGIKRSYEKYHQVIIEKNAITAAIILSQRYINDRFLPDKALDLIDEAQAKVKSKAVSFDMTKKIKRCLDQKRRMNQLKSKLVYNNEFGIASGLKKDEKELKEIMQIINKEQIRREQMTCLKITEQDIKEVVALRTGIPVDEMHLNEQAQILKLENRLKREVLGQNEAIKAVAQTIQRSMSGIQDPNRPLGSFIFLGPTGVGKTYLAKNLAEILFKNPSAFIRIDMSEFSEKHTVSQLIGAPAGYVGYEEGGKLTDKVRRNPYSLILFDEIEKAHPEVFNLLLQVLEDGILTDASGRTVNFRNTIIILTSNIGSKHLLEENLGFMEDNLLKTNAKKTSGNAEKQNGKAEGKAGKVFTQLREILQPELLNRIDKILIFNEIDLKNLERIAKKELALLAKRMKEQSITLKLQSAVYKLLAEKSFDKKEGARLLRKNIEELIQTPLSEIILQRKRKKPLTVMGKVKKRKIKWEQQEERKQKK